MLIEAIVVEAADGGQGVGAQLRAMAQGGKELWRLGHS
jgi:hypothetical protein